MILNKYHCYNNISRLSSLINVAESCNIANHLVSQRLRLNRDSKNPQSQSDSSLSSQFSSSSSMFDSTNSREFTLTLLSGKNKSYLLSNWKPFGIEWNNKFVEPLSAGVVPLRPEYLENVSIVQSRKRE